MARSQVHVRHAAAAFEGNFAARYRDPGFRSAGMHRRHVIGTRPTSQIACARSTALTADAGIMHMTATVITTQITKNLDARDTSARCPAGYFQPAAVRLGSGNACVEVPVCPAYRACKAGGIAREIMRPCKCTPSIISTHARTATQTLATRTPTRRATRADAIRRHARTNTHIPAGVHREITKS